MNNDQAKQYLSDHDQAEIEAGKKLFKGICNDIIIDARIEHERKEIEKCQNADLITCDDFEGVIVVIEYDDESDGFTFKINGVMRYAAACNCQVVDMAQTKSDEDEMFRSHLLGSGLVE